MKVGSQKTARFVGMFLALAVLGLAWALIFGLFASTAFTLVVVPVMYYVIYGRRLEAVQAGSGSESRKATETGHV